MALLLDDTAEGVVCYRNSICPCVNTDDVMHSV